MRTLGAIVLAGLLAAGCASPPTNIDDICVIFEEYPDWYPEARDASRRWGVSVPILMAIIRQESGFRHNARPAREWYLGFIPGSRPSTAYGYAQALDGTWERYSRQTGRPEAERHDFSDAVDFVGWYCDLSHRVCRIPKDDSYRLYLAYYEGQGGYNSRTWKGKARLLESAQMVSRRARLYSRQLEGCRKELEKGSSQGFWFF